MRTDYKETGTKSDDYFTEFPFDCKNPIILLGILKGNKGIYKEQAYGDSDLEDVYLKAKKLCKRGSIELIGSWAGKWRTDTFELNLEFMLESNGIKK